MLPAYTASVQYLAECRTALGPDHRNTAVATSTELLHLKNLFRTEELGSDRRTSVTNLMRHIRNDTSNVFSEEDRTSLIEAASSRLSSSSSTPLARDLRGGQKCQTHDYTFNYYSDDMWAVLMDSNKSMEFKMKSISREWLNWGLIFPSAPTFRSAVSTLMVASNLEASPDQAKSFFNQLCNVFRNLREVYRRSIPAATMKEFPETPAEFEAQYPNMVRNPAPCRVEVLSVQELSTKGSVPCRKSNSMLRSPTSVSQQTSKGPAAVADSSMSTMAALLDIVMNRASAHPPPEAPLEHCRPTRRLSLKSTLANWHCLYTCLYLVSFFKGHATSSASLMWL